MISRKHRFHGYGSLRQTYQKGTMIRGPLFALKVLLNPKRDSYRVAVVVSKKVNKSAVVRNRIRRRLYELVRENDQDILKPYDIVVTVFHDSVKDESYEVLAAQMKKQLSASGALLKRIN